MSDCRILSDLLFKIKDIKLFFPPPYSSFILEINLFKNCYRVVKSFNVDHLIEVETMTFFKEN